MLLLIKGNVNDAMKVLTDKGIGFFILQQLKYECVKATQVGDYHNDTVADWFNEPNGSPPYPPGTLLFYNEDK